MNELTSEEVLFNPHFRLKDIYKIDWGQLGLRLDGMNRFTCKDALDEQSTVANRKARVAKVKIKLVIRKGEVSLPLSLLFIIQYCLIIAMLI